ncbi:ADIPOR-like receptor [Trichinella patagoniensis]|uniref:ADIPOR-like receptor n=1 Tax=Trichinella patagoniensis TaxID=990121 RepID=A0A0V0ZG78_9BILA|nr:ADIPOR-like receptor [Trichinella patagoniensis]
MQPSNFSAEQPAVPGNDHKGERKRKHEEEDRVEVGADALTVEQKLSRQEGEKSVTEQATQQTVQDNLNSVKEASKEIAGVLETGQVVEPRPCSQDSVGTPAEQAVQATVQDNLNSVNEASKEIAGVLDTGQVVEPRPCSQDSVGTPAEQAVQATVQDDLNNVKEASKEIAGVLETGQVVEPRPCSQDTVGTPAEQAFQQTVQDNLNSVNEASKEIAGVLETGQVVEPRPCSQDSVGTPAEQAFQQTVQDNLNSVKEASKDNAGRLKNRPEAVRGATWTTTHVSTLPPWLQENEFVLHGHRPPLFSVLDCLLSIFQIHSETGNIWSHLIAFYIMYLLAQWHMTSASLKLEQKIPFLPYFASALGCLGFSASFHTMLCHSEWVSHLFRKLDHCGIAILITGSTVSWLYYLFYCHSWLYIIYAVLCMFLGIHSAVQTIKGDLSTAHHRFTRSLVFILNGLSAAIPCLHYRYMYGIPEELMGSIYLLLIMAFFYISGALIYSCRVPERLMPGRFDTWFQSHQIFHVFVFIALVFFYRSLVLIADYRLSTSC